MAGELTLTTLLRFPLDLMVTIKPGEFSTVLGIQRCRCYFAALRASGAMAFGSPAWKPLLATRQSGSSWRAFWRGVLLSEPFLCGQAARRQSPPAGRDEASAAARPYLQGAAAIFALLGAASLFPAR